MQQVLLELQVHKPVLFAGTKPLERAENLKAVYDAYDGSKAFVQVDPWRHHPDIQSGKYDVMICDEFPTMTPGIAILIGHGIAGGKTSGLEQPHPYMSPRDADLITYAINASPAMVSLVARYTGISEAQVLPLGMPRTDEYIGKKKGDGETELATKRAYLYAPTYRSREETPMPDIDWQWLDDHLTDDEILAVKPHTMTKNILNRTYKHIKEFEAYLPTAPFLYDCDVVISDYSTVIFDGYILNKPSVLFDKSKGYLDTRGMYLDYPAQYSSRYCTTEQELLEMIRKANELTEVEKSCKKLVAEKCDGHSVERICELIRSLI